MTKTRGSGIAVSIRAAIRASIKTERQRPSSRPAPSSKPHGPCFYRTGARPIFRPGAISETGLPRNTAASIAASGCRRIGSRHGMRRAVEISVAGDQGIGACRRKSGTRSCCRSRVRAILRAVWLSFVPRRESNALPSHRRDYFFSLGERSHCGLPRRVYLHLPGFRRQWLTVAPRPLYAPLAFDMDVLRLNAGAAVDHQRFPFPGRPCEGQGARHDGSAVMADSCPRHGSWSWRLGAARVVSLLMVRRRASAVSGRCFASPGGPAGRTMRPG
jgi:hypothetical protein